MSLPHFYLEKQILSQEDDASFDLGLSDEDLKHARALRLAPGEHIAVVDADLDYFQCCIDSFDRSVLRVHIAQQLSVSERPSIILAQGLAKGDKMDTIIRHATEVGVRAFIPLLCERSIVKLDQKKTATRMNRWNLLAKSAAMQSGQPAVPLVGEPQSISELSVDLDDLAALLICWEEAPMTCTISQALSQALTDAAISPADACVMVVVGPEGGLSQSEVDSLLALHPHSYLVSLGPTILRTETAGIVAPALVLYELER